MVGLHRGDDGASRYGASRRMSPFIAHHATRQACRDSIQREGILPSRPTALQPYGVYVFRDDTDIDHNTWSRGRCLRWAHDQRQDVWRVAYIGPMRPDHLVTNAMVLLERVRPSEVTLVTRNR